MSFKAGYHTISFLFILVSFVFLLFATISYPVVDIFALSKTSDNKYGIFGVCSTSNSNDCTVGYPLDFAGSMKDNSSGYLFINDTRTTLAKIFVLAPIALGFDLILLIVIFAIHFGSRITVLVGIFLNVISTIASIIACVVIILCFYPHVTWVPWTLVAAAAITFISLILLIISLTVVGNDDDDDDAKSNFDNEDFGRFTNYNRIDDKFNHIQTATFKTSNSLDNDYEYKPHNNNSTNVNNTNFAGGAMNKFPNNNGTVNNSRGAVNGGSTTGSGVGSGTVISGMNPPGHKNGSLTSNSSSYYNNPQTATDFTQRNKPNAYQPSSLGAGSNNGNTASSLPYPPGTPIVNNNNNSRNNYQPGVFDHHLGVEGHKPFTELDDDFDDEEEDLANNRREIVNTNDSDNDSDFTSVSQRPPNPQYYGSNSGNGTVGGGGYLPSSVVNQYSNVQQYQPLHQQGMPPGPPPPQQHRPTGQYSPSTNMGYNNMPLRSGGGVPPPVAGSYFPNQGPVPPPAPPSQQQQVRGPTISDNVLNNNPDFQFSRGGQQQKRRVNPGFVPVAARYNNNQTGPGSKNQNASALMGRRENTGPRNGPYGITR
ncbi:hypothetical membrane protein, conserved [Candida dubliniensis CD36]|uniref:Hypothetical membrane protein, conserved n=1 Tax=Candida dubliniensis (strain CD36 / ATCC MYA-646 / CBS 7987 / NCPF 3949 / NRRL Y-17841) TaxID=573826 RepID=B9WAN7_CANDC|nr:hypothetical membrane protein, conserved [Candida dubliniensis CD36]CAX43457.1 hypothetical membrane protein, conserved [Candida dubliniensis CD36]